MSGPTAGVLEGSVCFDSFISSRGTEAPGGYVVQAKDNASHKWTKTLRLQNSSQKDTCLILGVEVEGVGRAGFSLLVS